MHPSALLLLMVVATTSAASMVRGQPAAGTPAAQFWDKVLPGSPMPEAIADLVQEGIDDLPLVEHASPSISPDAFRNYDSSASPSNSATASAYLYDSSSSRVGGPDNAMVPPPGLFFYQAEARVGMTMKVFFPPAAVSPILPREVAETVPFNNLTEVLTTFHVAPDSAYAAALDDTLRGCEAPPTADEKKACSVSLEGIVQSAMGMLGTSTGRQVWAVASAIRRTGLPMQQYVVEEVTPLDGDRHVGCHDVPFPYAIYLCHMTGRPTKAYMVSLRGVGGGPAVTMAALCHLDTSKWSRAHPAFEVLHTQPGGAPVCHFMPYANLVFGEKAAKA